MMQDDGTAALSKAGLAALQQADAGELADGMRNALQGLSADDLPNQLCCDRGGLISPEDWSIDLIDAEWKDTMVRARLGLFFTEIVGGCNCHDDPAQYSEHRLLTLCIDSVSGQLAWTTAEVDTP